jgi:methionyl-tRNA synthetase
MDKLNVPEALVRIWSLIQRANKYIDETMPWALSKDPAKRERLKSVLYNLAESIRIENVALLPFLVNTPASIFEKLGIADEKLKSLKSIEKFGAKIDGLTVNKGEALFPRYDLSKELKEMDRLKEEAEVKKEVKAEAENVYQIISIDDFMKVNLRVAKVITAERIEKSDKLLKLSVDVAGKPRTIVAGIAKYYKPEEVQSRTVIIVENLAPAKLRGIESEGMVLCAADSEGRLALVTPDKPMPSGSEVR